MIKQILKQGECVKAEICSKSITYKLLIKTGKSSGILFSGILSGCRKNGSKL